jgi:hypothetical protein
MAIAWRHVVPPCDYRPLGPRQLERIVLRRALHGPVRFLVRPSIRRRVDGYVYRDTWQPRSDRPPQHNQDELAKTCIVPDRARGTR